MDRSDQPSLEDRGRETRMGRKLTCIKKIREVWAANFLAQLIDEGLRLPLEPYDGILSKSVTIAVREGLTIDEFADEDLKWFPNDPLTRNEGRASARLVELRGSTCHEHRPRELSIVSKRGGSEATS
jgi:hypothetical protein